MMAPEIQQDEFSPEADTGFLSDEYFDLKSRIHDRLLDLLDLSKLDRVDPVLLKPELRKVVDKILREDFQSLPLNAFEKERLYTEIMDSLGVQKACFIGASQGGFISTNIALNTPERVEKIILCGPMGYTGTNTSVLRILFTTMFPVKPIQESATRWAFGNDQKIQDAVGKWFQLILEGVISRQARPQPFSQEQLQRLSMPVLLLLGSRDGLVGNPENAKQHVQCIANVQVEILDTGHLISAEKPDQFNKLVYDFIEQHSKE